MPGGTVSRRAPNPLRRPIRRAPLAVIAVAAALVSACGGSSDNEAEAATGMSSTASSTASRTMSGDAAEAETLAVTADDYSFELDEDSVSAGTYEITLTNDGEATH